jgi:hypothetical protein
MKKTYELTAQQALIIKAITEGLPLQYESAYAGSGKWVDSVNTVSELFTVTSTQGGSSLVYRIKPKVYSVETQAYVIQGSGGELMRVWCTASGPCRAAVEATGDFKRWVGFRQIIELEQAQ